MTSQATLDFVDEAMKFERIFDHDLMYRIEECCQSNAVGQHRRGLLGMLTMDSEKLFEACEAAPEAFFELFKLSAETVSEQKELADLLGKAHARLMIGLCGTDPDAPGAPFTKEEFLAAIEKSHEYNNAKGGAS